MLLAAFNSLPCKCHLLSSSLCMKVQLIQKKEHYFNTKISLLTNNGKVLFAYPIDTLVAAITLPKPWFKGSMHAESDNAYYKKGRQMCFCSHSWRLHLTAIYWYSIFSFNRVERNINLRTVTRPAYVSYALQNQRWTKQGLIRIQLLYVSAILSA